MERVITKKPMSSTCPGKTNWHYMRDDGLWYSNSPMFHCDNRCPFEGVDKECMKVCSGLTAKTRPCLQHMNWGQRPVEPQGDVQVAVKELLNFKLGNRHLNKDSDMYTEGDEDTPFFSEAYLYNLLDKDDARTVLGQVKNLLGALGLSYYDCR